jgi:hypothetical protein
MNMLNSTQCCVNCGKSYKKRENLNKHLFLCTLLDKSRKSKGPIVIEQEEVIDLPSSRKMFEMLIALGQKYVKLEEEMVEVKKWVEKKKKKINVLDWLHMHVIPSVNFDTMVASIVVSFEDAKFILNHSFHDTFHHLIHAVFKKEGKEGFLSIFAFDQKINTFYIYNDCWIEASRENLTWFFNKMHMKLINAFYQWKKVGIAESNLNKDQFETACDKALIKLMDVDFRVENMFSKVRNILFKELKTNNESLC